MQYVGSDAENIRYRATSNPNITNQRINLGNLKSAMNITLHYAISITIHFIEVIQKHVTVLMGRCAKFGKLIRKRKYEGGRVGVCTHIFLLLIEIDDK